MYRFRFLVPVLVVPGKIQPAIQHLIQHMVVQVDGLVGGPVDNA